VSIEIRGGIIRCYGNKVGYIDGDKVVADTLFATPELSGWLSERKLETDWRDGVYDKLNSPQSDAAELKRVRVWQLRDDVDPMMKFISYDETLRDYGEPDIGNYECVYDGQPGTNDLEQIFEMFNVSRPKGFEGHSLSMSDVVELYDDSSEFYYIDRFGFREIEFGGGQLIEQSQGQTMGGLT
jgi:hypothetical protein